MLQLACALLLDINTFYVIALQCCLRFYVVKPVCATRHLPVAVLGLDTEICLGLEFFSHRGRLHEFFYTTDILSISIFQDVDAC